jgi:hypothetical protein
MPDLSVTVHLIDITTRRSGGLVLDYGKLGGTTRGKWRLSSNRQLDLRRGWNSSLVRRSLQHFLNHATKGGRNIKIEDLNKSKRKREEQIKTWLYGKDRVGINITNIEVVSPLVFSCTQWVVRELSLLEMLECYDVQVNH